MNKEILAKAVKRGGEWILKVERPAMSFRATRIMLRAFLVSEGYDLEVANKACEELLDI